MRVSPRLLMEIAGEAARRPPGLYGGMRRLIETSERLDASCRSAIQHKLLHRVLHAARGVPAYGTGAAALVDVPQLTKERVTTRPQDYLAGGLRAVSRAHTSGTSGLSVAVARSISCVAFEQAAIDWTVQQAGASFRRDRVAVMRGSDIKEMNDQEPPFWRLSPSGRILTFSSNHLSARTFPHFRRALAEFRPTILFAYPSVAEHLARLAAASGLRIPLVLTSSETLSATARRNIAETFSADTVDYYGQAERVAFAYSLEPGRYRFMPSYGVVEFASAESGLEVVGTALHNFGQFLLRYRTGDHILPPERPDDLAEIALGTRFFGGISGRLNDVLHGPAGEVLVGIDHIPRGLERYGRFQFRQTAPDRVLISVSAQLSGSAEDRAAIIARAREKIPSSVHLDIRFDQQPQRTRSGKSPLVICDYERTE